MKKNDEKYLLPYAWTLECDEFLALIIQAFILMFCLCGFW